METVTTERIKKAQKLFLIKSNKIDTPVERVIKKK